MDAVELVSKSYPTIERRRKNKINWEVNYNRAAAIRRMITCCLSLASRLLGRKKWLDGTSWAGHCVVVQKVRSSWFLVRVSRSCHRSRLVCDWWIVPGAEHLNVFNSSTCAKSQNSRLAFTSATITSQSKPLLKPWVLPFTPTYRGNKSHHELRVTFVWPKQQKTDLTRQCSFPWFSQWPVLPVRMILWSWLVFTQIISSTRSYLGGEKKRQARSDRSKDDDSGLDGSQSTNGKTHPQRLRHSRPSSIALSG